jgi:hypothetical protein
LKSSLGDYLMHTWMHAIVPPHVDVAIVRAANVTFEVEALLKFPTAILTVKSQLELEA